MCTAVRAHTASMGAFEHVHGALVGAYSTLMCVCLPFGNNARVNVVPSGATAAEVTKMVLSGRVHVHGMHYIELQVRSLLRVANEGCCTGLCSAHALFRSPLPSPRPIFHAEFRRCL